MGCTRHVKTLFDLRTTTSHDGFLKHVNDVIEKHDPGYIERYGRVGSEQWWKLYEQQRISRTILCGEVILVGAATDDFGETEPIVRLRTDRGLVEYDLELFWTDPAIQPGRWIIIEQAQTVIQTRSGPNITGIDTRICVDDGV
jgi:hypothetical protein